MSASLIRIGYASVWGLVIFGLIFVGAICFIDGIFDMSFFCVIGLILAVKTCVEGRPLP